MRKRILGSLVLVLGLIFGFCVSFCFAEESITITTYYPSPYGVYRVLRLFPNGDLVPGTDCSSDGEGAMTYYKDPANPANGLFLLCTGDPLVWTSISESIGAIFQNLFTVPGPYTFKVPPGVTKINVMVQGGGGGAGMGWQGADCSLYFCSSGAGGGAGGYASRVLAVTPKSIYTVVVGAGGAGGKAGSHGADGGPSSFGSLVFTQGGAGAENVGCLGGPWCPGGITGGVGGVGGAASGGDVNLTGGNGDNASSLGGVGRGGSPGVASPYGRGGDNFSRMEGQAGQGGAVVVEW